MFGVSCHRADSAIPVRKWGRSQKIISHKLHEWYPYFGIPLRTETLDDGRVRAGIISWQIGDCNCDEIPQSAPLPPFSEQRPFGPTIRYLAKFSAAEVHEQFLPIGFYTRLARETNTYYQRCQEGKADADEEALASNPDLIAEEKRVFLADNDLKWKDVSAARNTAHLLRL